MKRTRNKWFIMGIVFCLATAFVVGLSGFARAETKEVPKEVNIAAIFMTQLEDPWNMSLIQALERVKEEKPHGLNVNFDYTESVPSPDAERVLYTYAKTGKYDIIMAHSNYTPALDRPRKEYPEIVWEATGEGNELMGGNGYVINYALHEPAYLLGMIAGMMTKTNIIGVVAPFPYPNKNAPINAYHEGAKLVNPNVKLVVSFTESWFDPPKAKEFALAQIAAGADVEYANTFGILEACKGKGVYAFGHEIDQNYLAPEVVLTSDLVLWDPAVKFLINEWWNYVTEGVPYNAPMKQVIFPMKDGGADIAPYHQLADKIPDQVKKAVEKKREEIINGSFTVPYLPQKAVSTR